MCPNSSLKYYYSNYIYYTNQYNNLNNKNVNFAWNNNLAHIYFNDFEVEIGGQIVETYSLEQALIYQKHQPIVFLIMLVLKIQTH